MWPCKVRACACSSMQGVCCSKASDERQGRVLYLNVFGLPLRAAVVIQ